MAANTALAPVVLNEASQEIRAQYLDCAKARRLLDWRPAYDLETGFQETIVRYRQHLNAGHGVSANGATRAFGGRSAAHTVAAT